MSGNPFWEVTEDVLQGERVRVKTPNGTYTGLVALFEYQDNAVLLRDATTPAGMSTPSVLIDNPQAIEHQPTATDREIRTVSIDAVEPQPYNVREYGSPSFAAFVREVRRNDGVSNLPLVRPLPASDSDDGGAQSYQIVAGHRRVAALRRAHIEDHPMIVRPLDDWAATARYIDEHFPLTASEREAADHSDSDWYSPVQMQAAYEQLQDDWEESQLRSHPAIAVNTPVVEADEDPDRVHTIVLEELPTATTVPTAAPDDDIPHNAPDESTTSEDFVGKLAAMVQADSEEIRAHAMKLKEFGVSPETIEATLRRTYPSVR